MSGSGAGAELLVVAGEVSGDLHAANLVRELGRLLPELRVFGVGGERLAAEGMELLARSEELAHMGLLEVVRELPRIRRLLVRVAEAAVRRRPAAAVLVDSPDFNLRLARRLREAGIPVILYVSPQLWAWRRGRVRVVRRLAREVLCILPFEVPFYHRFGVPARFVGHPLVDDLVREGLWPPPPERRPRLALLPGSRRSEVRALLPAMLAALEGVPRERISEAVIVAAPGVEDEISRQLETGADPRLRVVAGPGRRRALAAAELAWTASGTATLECALLDVPMVVGYRLHPLSYAVARLLVDVPHVALVNLVAGERAAPELLQGAWRPDRIAAVTGELLAGGAEIQRRALATVREALGEPGASRRAAEAVREVMR